MARLTMKDYENFLEEEARQDRLQEELEYKRHEEAYEAEENWRDYQREQEEERRREEFNRYPEYDGYFDERDFLDDWEPEGEYDPDCYSNPYPDDDDPYDDGRRYDYDCDDDDWDDYDPDDDDSDDDDLNELYQHHYFEYLEIMNSELEGMSATTERISRKAVARNRHLSKVKAKKSKAQKANYVAKREMRICCKLYRNLDKAYWQLANKAYSNGYLPYSMCQNMERRVNATLDQMSDIVLKAHYFECLLGAPMYKQALSAPKAM